MNIKSINSAAIVLAVSSQVLAFSITDAHAAPVLSDYSITGSVYIVGCCTSDTPVNDPVSAPGTVSGSFSSVNGSTGNGSVTVGLNQYVSASINLTAGGSNSPGSGHIGGSASADLYYSLRILGPTTSVPVIVGANGGATISDPLQVIDTTLTSFFLINNGLFLKAGDSEEKFNSQDIDGFSWSLNKTITFQTNTVYNIDLKTLVLTNIYFGYTANLSAFVDPSFTIDPSTPNANQYVIEFSPGITNAVPEPSTWVMMILGFAGLGFVGYRSRSGAMNAA